MASQNFTVEVKPTIGAIQQQAGVYTAGDLLFDWAEFELPSGGAKLTGVTTIIRPKGDTAPTPNNFSMDLIFGKLGSTLGTSNAVFNIATPTEDIIGACSVPAATAGTVSTSCTSVGNVNGLDISIHPAQHPIKGTNVGFDKFYVAGIATGAFFFTTATNIIQDDGAASATLHCDGSSADLRQHFLPGDIIQTGTTVSGIAAGTTLGTVQTVDSDTNITLTAASTTALKDGMLLYNTKPIKLLLHFQK